MNYRAQQTASHIQNMYQAIFSFFLLIVIAFHGAKGKCPLPESVEPCICSTGLNAFDEEFSTITCQNLESESVLEYVLAESKWFQIGEFRLIDSSLRYIPHDAFTSTTFQVFKAVNSSLTSLSDSDVAFQGLEKTLSFIEISGCSFVNDWDWSQLSHLKNLEEISIKKSDIVDLTDGLSKIQHIYIQTFKFQENQIEWLDDNVFSPFTNLNAVFLDRNSISSLKRSMFPRPTKYLQAISVSYNKIESLPRDIFVEMPLLGLVNFAGNPIRTIDENVFRPIWNQLEILKFYDTCLACDCRLSWFIDVEHAGKNIYAECHSPPALAGKKLTSLKYHDLWC